MLFHLPTDTPYFRNVRITQHPIPFCQVADVDHTTGLRLQAFGRVVGELGQGLGVGNADADWNAGTAQYLGADLPTEAVQTIDAS